MSIEYLMGHREQLFVLISCFFIALSWRQLLNPFCHGFYRFFAFEGITIIVLLNLPYWLKDPFSPLQLLSWLLLFTSIAFVIQGFQLLKNLGGSKRTSAKPENLAFENTVNLVVDGIYGYVRHPMYGSLLLLTWGAFLKHLSLPGFIVASVSSVFILVTAKIEERENTAFFGDAYKSYIKKSKMFIPFII